MRIFSSRGGGATTHTPVVAINPYTGRIWMTESEYASGRGEVSITGVSPIRIICITVILTIGIILALTWTPSGFNGILNAQEDVGGGETINNNNPLRLTPSSKITDILQRSFKASPSPPPPPSPTHPPSTTESITDASTISQEIPPRQRPKSPSLTGDSYQTLLNNPLLTSAIRKQDLIISPTVCPSSDPQDTDINEFGILHCLREFDRISDDLKIKAAVYDLEKAKSVKDIRNTDFPPITVWKEGETEFRSYFEIDEDTSDITLHDVCMQWYPPHTDDPFGLDTIARRTEMHYFEFQSTPSGDKPIYPLGRTGQPLIPFSKFTLFPQYAKLYSTLTPANLVDKWPYIAGTTYQTIAMDSEDDLFLHSILPTVARLFPAEIYLESLDPVFHSSRMPLIHYLLLNNGCATRRLDYYFGEPSDSAFSDSQLMIFAAAIAKSTTQPINLGYAGCPLTAICFENLVLPGENFTANHPVHGKQKEIRTRTWAKLRNILYDKFNIGPADKPWEKSKEDPTLLPPLRVSVYSHILPVEDNDNALINIEELFAIFPEWTARNRPIVLRHFYSFNSLNYGEQAAIFSQSDIVIASSASDLALSFLMPNNSTIIEIVNYGKKGPHRPPATYLQSLEEAFGHNRIILEPTNKEDFMNHDWSSGKTPFSEYIITQIAVSNGYIINVEELCDVLLRFDVVCETSITSNPRLQALSK